MIIYPKFFWQLKKLPKILIVCRQYLSISLEIVKDLAETCVFVYTYVCMFSNSSQIDGWIYLNFGANMDASAQSILTYFQKLSFVFYKNEFDWQHSEDLTKTVTFIKQFLCVLVFFLLNYCLPYYCSITIYHWHKLM